MWWIVAWWWLAATLQLGAEESQPVPVDGEQEHAFQSDIYFGATYFGPLLARHHAATPQFKAWRYQIAQHASQLAEIVRTFPGAEAYEVSTLQRLLQQPLGVAEPWCERDFFSAWTNRWTGLWSNRRPQYHTWDATRYWQGQWIQPVVQSEYRFLEPKTLRRMLSRKEADLAINVFNHEVGISGWVSKRQHGPKEIPCIGYLLEPNTLLWFAQMPTAKDGRNQWFIFLERITDRGQRYHIYGQPVWVAEGIDVVPAERNRHQGTYCAVMEKGVVGSSAWACMSEASTAMSDLPPKRTPTHWRGMP